jgi:methionyl-tRNA synthetase
VAQFVASGLRDVSVSRSRTRARGWGLPVPGDPDQVVWVWLDALANYLATVSFPDDEARWRRDWSDAERRVHVVGKGITRFHAVLWPALLLSAGLPLPTAIWVHGYVTLDGEKIGKSRGNVIAPEAIVGKYGADALRYFLLRHVGPRRDGDVDEARLDAVYRGELADGLGNLLARTLALLRTAAGGRVPPTPAPNLDVSGEELAAEAADLQGRVDDAIERFAPDDALRAIWDVVARANGHLAVTAPWALAKREGERPRALAVLHHTATAITVVGRALQLLLPTTAAAITAAFENPAAPAPLLFPKDRVAATA